MTQNLSSLSSHCAEFSVQSTLLSQHAEVLTVSHNSSDSGDLSQVITKQLASLGIMVLSPACKVLYANEAAYHFLKVLNRRENGHATQGAFPDSITDLFDQTLKSLENRIADRDHDQLEARRSLVGQDQSVQLQAFGLPDRLGMQRPRVVITMKSVIRPCDAESGEVILLSI
jgi:hypothetical protein